MYVVVSLAEIEKTSVTVRGTIKDRTTQTVTGSSYMLQDIVANVNTKDGRFLKYIPDQMLSKEQIESKQSVIDFDNVRLDSMRNVKQNSVRDNLSSIPDQFEKVWSEKSDEDKAAIIRAMKNKALLQLNSPERVFA